jgi:adenylate kinase family enzyme
VTNAPAGVSARRILVYGVTGAGKTTLAAQIAARTGLPWYSVDDLTWEPGWVAVPEEEQRRRIESICAGDEWILDTAYRTWMDVPLETVEMIVALDYPRLTSLSRLTRRCLRRVVTRERACNGNIETVRNLLSRDSIIRWHFRSFSTKRRRMREWASSPSPPRVVPLRSPRDARRWLDTLERVLTGP